MEISKEEHQRLLTQARIGYVGGRGVVAESAAEGTYRLPLPVGAILRDFTLDGQSPSFRVGETVYTIPDGGNCVFDGPAQRSVENLLSVLKAFEGVPYLWGGQTSWGADCSGFVQAVFRIFGMEIPRDARQQVELGREISLEEVRAGHLAFFSLKGRNRAKHVGILFPQPGGELAMVHARQRVKYQLLVRQSDRSDDLIDPERQGKDELISFRALIGFE